MKHFIKLIFHLKSINTVEFVSLISPHHRVCWKGRAEQGSCPWFVGPRAGSPLCRAPWGERARGRRAPRFPAASAFCPWPRLRVPPRPEPAHTPL